MTKKTKKHGNVGKRNALRGSYTADLVMRITEDQEDHLRNKAKSLKVKRSDVVRELIDDDIKKQD